MKQTFFRSFGLFLPSAFAICDHDGENAAAPPQFDVRLLFVPVRGLRLHFKTCRYETDTTVGLLDGVGRGTGTARRIAWFLLHGPVPPFYPCGMVREVRADYLATDIWLQ